MNPIYFPIIKGLDAEKTAIEELGKLYSSKFLPLVEIPKIDFNHLPKYLSAAGTPIFSNISKVIDRFKPSFNGRMIMFDSYYWNADTYTETGEHIYTNIIHQAQSSGLIPIPVIGYDRISDPIYYKAIKSLNYSEFPAVCIRIDKYGIEDAHEKSYFQKKIKSIANDLKITPENIFVLIDFGDSFNESEEYLYNESTITIEALKIFNFKFYILSGTSIPPTIDKSIKKQNTQGIVPRKEFSVWKKINSKYNSEKITILFSDYAIRSPSNIDPIPNKNSNGKIRYTINDSFYIIRGHSVSSTNGSGYKQYYDLAKTLVSSSHFFPTLSWGDQQVTIAASNKGKVAHAHWISVDTNHHITFVISEIHSLSSSKIVNIPATSLL